MPAQPIRKTRKINPAYIAKFAPPNLDVGNIEPSEFKRKKDYRTTLINYFSLDIAALKGVGPKLAAELRAMKVPSIGVFYYDLRFTQRKRNRILRLLENYPIAQKEARKILATKNKTFLNILKSYKSGYKRGKHRVIRTQEIEPNILERILNETDRILTEDFGVYI